MYSKEYDKTFFKIITDESLTSAKNTVPIILKYIQPLSVLDVGCGLGAWLTIWKENGIKEIAGLDGDFINKDDILIDPQEFIICNLENGFTVNKRYDLVTCLEVAEHIQSEKSEQLINSLCKVGDIILFSAAIPNQEGVLHVNEQFTEYWIHLFKNNDYNVYDTIRPEIWDNKNIAWWYRQNILFFIKNSEKDNYPKITFENKNVKSIVHPELLEYKQGKINNYEKILQNPINTTKYFCKKYLRLITTLFKK